MTKAGDFLLFTVPSFSSDPLFAQFIVIGERRKFPSALLTIKTYRIVQREFSQKMGS